MTLFSQVATLWSTPLVSILTLDIEWTKVDLSYPTIPSSSSTFLQKFGFEFFFCGRWSMFSYQTLLLTLRFKVMDSYLLLSAISLFHLDNISKASVMSIHSLMDVSGSWYGTQWAHTFWKFKESWMAANAEPWLIFLIKYTLNSLWTLSKIIVDYHKSIH